MSLNIPYFVKDNFHTEYQGSVGRLEASVEEEYVTTLKHACYRERNYSKCNENSFDYSFNKCMSGLKIKIVKGRNVHQVLHRVAC